MAKFRYAANEAGSRTQDPIQTRQSTGGEASIERGAVVKPVCNEGMYKGGSCRCSEGTSDSAELAQLVEAVAAKEVYMGGKAELSVINPTSSIQTELFPSIPLPFKRRTFFIKCKGRLYRFLGQFRQLLTFSLHSKDFFHHSSFELSRNCFINPAST